MRFALFLVISVVAVSGCGGTAVVEEGTGGAGNGASSSSGSASSGSSSSQSASTAVGATTGVSTGQSSGTGVDCNTLTAQYLAALDAATACNACQDFDACIGGPTLVDQCNCPVPLNGQATDLYANAKELGAVWQSNGCGPSVCGTPCLVGRVAYCQGGTGDCVGACSY